MQEERGWHPGDPEHQRRVRGRPQVRVRVRGVERLLQIPLGTVRLRGERAVLHGLHQVERHEARKDVRAEHRKRAVLDGVVQVIRQAAGHLLGPFVHGHYSKDHLL